MSIIKSSFIDPLLTLISTYNASVTFLCVTKKNFLDFMRAPWQLSPLDIHLLNKDIQQSTKGKTEAYRIAGEAINATFYVILKGFEEVVLAAPNFIDEALRPLEETQQKKHQPHLGLLFTFLELFNNLQGNINELGKEHLDFFYKRVLQITPRKAVPDKAHIVFEIAKHLDEYLLKKDLLLKDGKDSNNQDIQFGLDHEIIIDKGQVADLRTLSVFKNTKNDYIDGVYIVL